MDWFFKYYCIDWILFVLVITQIWLLGNRNRFAFLIGMLGCCFGFSLGIMINSAASMTMNSVFFVMYLRAYCQWSLNDNYCDNFKPRLAEDTFPEEEQ